MGFGIDSFPNFKNIKAHLYHILCSTNNIVLGVLHNKNTLTFMKQNVHSPWVKNKNYMNAHIHMYTYGIYIYIAHTHTHKCIHVGQFRSSSATKTI